MLFNNVYIMFFVFNLQNHLFTEIFAKCNLIESIKSVLTVNNQHILSALSDCDEGSRGYSF